MDPLRFVRLLVLCACLWSACTRISVWSCCEGDVLLLLDSSGSITAYEFSRLLLFLTELFQPFVLGRGSMRVGLVQVGTEPRLEFDLDAHDSQNALQEALRSTQQLHGDTNTEAALRLVQSLIRPHAPPTVLLWLTDGVEPGAVDGPIAALRQLGVSVLVVSTGHGNYQLLRRIVTPPIETNLYFIDIDDISIITEHLQEAITAVVGVERLWVGELRSSSVVLQWRPALSGGTNSLHYRLKASDGSRSTKLHLPGDASWAELTDLRPDSNYTAWITTDTSIPDRRRLHTSFRTLPGEFGAASVVVSDVGVDSLRVSWSPVEPGVQQFSVEYGEIPSGPVQILTLPSYQSSALLVQLRPHTEYLITVAALHSSGQQRAVSIRACTPQVLPPLTDLQLTPVGQGSVQVDWRSQAQGAGLQGYWVSWEREDQLPSSSSSSSLYLPKHVSSTRLTELRRSSRVCVSPVYRSARGEGICCSTHT